MFDKINADMGINLSASNTETFRALHRKLERDYRPFLQSILKKYPGPSNINNKARAAVMDVDATIDLFGNALRENIISATVAKELGTALRTNLSTIAELFQANMVNEEFTGAFLSNLEKIKKETGIGTESLTVSEKAIEQGEREAKAASSKALEMLKPMAPLGNKLKSAGMGAMTALAGPFAPMLDPVVGALGNMGKKAWKNATARKKDSGTKDALEQMNVKSGEVRSAAQFRSGHGSEAPGMAAAMANQGFAGRQDGPAKPMSGRGSNLASMVLFYNKHAYTSKWTKELLETTKKILSGLTGKSGSLGVFALKLGGVAAIAAEVGIIANSIMKWTKSGNELDKSVKTGRDAYTMSTNAIKEMGVEEYTKQTGKTKADAVASKALELKMMDQAQFRADTTGLGGSAMKNLGLKKPVRTTDEEYRQASAGAIGTMTTKQEIALLKRQNTERNYGTSESEIAEILKEITDRFNKTNEALADKIAAISGPAQSKLPSSGSRPSINTQDSWDYQAGDGGI